MSWKRKEDPVILIDSYHIEDDIQLPITSKPRPVLLAPPMPGESPLNSSSFASLQSPFDTTNTIPHSSHYQCSSNCSDISANSYHLSASEQFPSALTTTAVSTAVVDETSPLSANKYYTVIQKQSQEIQELRRDLIKLNQKYIEQIDRIQTAEQAQFLVESELEDLSLGLFEQANQMVADEKKARFKEEKKVQQLEKELAMVYEELENEREQLKELRQRFMEQEQPQHQQQQQQQQQAYKFASLHPFDIRSSSSTLKEDSSCDDFDESEDDDETTTTSISSHNNIHLDVGWLSLFEEFLELAPNTPLELLYRLPFMKQCMELDIDPCLRFSNVKNTNGRLSMRKVLEAVIHEPCFIESDHHHHQKRHSQDNRSLNSSSPMESNNKLLAPIRRSSFAYVVMGKSRSSANQQQLACYGCGAKLMADEHQEQFRFRLREQDTQSYWIDRACRDRLVAVCDFYVFIRHVRLGLTSQKTVQSLFQECAWLRLCMFWARSGVHHHHHRQNQKSDLLFVQ